VCERNGYYFTVVSINIQQLTHNYMEVTIYPNSARGVLFDNLVTLTSDPKANLFLVTSRLPKLDSAVKLPRLQDFPDPSSEWYKMLTRVGHINYGAVNNPLSVESELFHQTYPYRGYVDSNAPRTYFAPTNLGRETSVTVVAGSPSDYPTLVGHENIWTQAAQDKGLQILAQFPCPPESRLGESRQADAALNPITNFAFAAGYMFALHIPYPSQLPNFLKNDKHHIYILMKPYSNNARYAPDFEDLVELYHRYTLQRTKDVFKTCLTCERPHIHVMWNLDMWRSARRRTEWIDQLILEVGQSKVTVGSRRFSHKLILEKAKNAFLRDGFTYIKPEHLRFSPFVSPVGRNLQLDRNRGDAVVVLSPLNKKYNQFDVLHPAPEVTVKQQSGAIRCVVLIRDDPEDKLE
jgi:hypothetical protein